MLASKLRSSIGNTDKLYVDDVFSAYTYTGNGSTQTINNGIDLAGKGGLVWLKQRTYAGDNTLNSSHDWSVNGRSNTAAAYVTTNNPINSVSGTGFAVQGSLQNASGNGYVSWTFRKAPKFFDVVTYTGNGAGNRTIAHSLGVAPGMVIVKCTSASRSWLVWHRSLSPNAEVRLNDTASAYTPTPVNFSSAPTGTNITTNGDINISGASYVAYLFAHDTAADGLIQCGSFIVPGGAGVVAVNLGWEPQYVLFKEPGISSWRVIDSARGFGGSQELTSKTLEPNSNATESGGQWGQVTATGFSTYAWTAGEAIYLAIRRPNKPPTSGTQVYNASLIASGVAATTPFDVGFPTDMSVFSITDFENAANNHKVVDRLRGGGVSLNSSSNSAEAVLTSRFDLQNSAVIEVTSLRRVMHSFRRAPGFFDVVCYTGTGVARTVSHSLGVAPELMIVKGRDDTWNWGVYSASLGNTKYLNLHLTNSAGTMTSYWNGTSPTSTVFTTGANNNAVNGSAKTYVAYLFATLPGISKVGSYTGNGSSQTINCGFSAGARFILIKRTDSAGDWYVWDTARGIVSANDPHLSLNTTAAEVTSNDSVDPNSTGFIVNQVTATNINVTGSTYLYLAIA